MRERALHNIDETWWAGNGWQEKASRLDGTTTCSHTHTLELFSKLVTVLCVASTQQHPKREREDNGKGGGHGLVFCTRNGARVMKGSAEVGGYL